ncbi:MAG: hypothetical protein IKN49_06915 [Elusimicrobiaceae bacterium]|nr:hypothetical protein [Elusimicrobiaceae bacterium]
MKNNNPRLALIAEKFYLAHPDFVRKSLMSVKVFADILSVLGIFGGIILLFVGQWRLALQLLVFLLIGKFCLGLVLCIRLIFFAPAVALFDKGGFFRALSFIFWLLSALFFEFIMWMFSMGIFQTAVAHTENSNMFVIICAMLASYLVSTGIVHSMAEKNNTADALNFIFYSTVWGVLYLLFACALLPARAVIALCFVVGLLKAVALTILLFVDNRK